MDQLHITFYVLYIMYGLCLYDISLTFYSEEIAIFVTTQTLPLELRMFFLNLSVIGILPFFCLILADTKIREVEI